MLCALAPRVSAATNDFFFRGVASDLANYDTIWATQAVSGATPVSRSPTVTSGATDDLIYSYVGSAVGVTSLSSGVWTMNLWVTADQNNNGDGTIKAYVFARTAAGAENLLFTSSYGTALPPNNVNQNTIWTFTTTSPRSVNRTDRLVFKLYATQVVNKVAGDIFTFNYDAAARPSKITAPFDVTPPNQVTNLGAVTGGVGKVTLSWSAPGNDGALNNLLAGSKYLAQYSTFIAAWSTASAQVTISTSNVAPGASQVYDIGGLTGGTSYYFDLWTQDENGNYSDVSSTASAAAGRPAAPGTLAPALTAVWSSSASAQWTNGGNPAGTSYNLQASTAGDFSGLVFTSSTLNASAALPGLSPGTSYALLVDAVIGISSSVYLALGSTVAIPAAPASAASTFTEVDPSSVTLQWTDPLNPAQTQYSVRASTASNFTGTLFSSATYNLSAALVGLSGRTTYFFQVSASTNGRTGPFAALGSTVTLVSAPALLPSPLTAVYVTSATAGWAAGGNGAGTLYNLQASTASDFSGTLSSSGTYNTTGTVTGLSTSTLYFLRVDAVVTGSSSSYVSLGSTPTLPSLPLSLVSTYTMVGVSSAAVQWNGNGNGPAASYDLQASTAANFTGTLFSTVPAVSPGMVTGLSGSSTYYFRVRSRTGSGASLFTALGSTLTLNNPAVPPGAAAPAFLMVGPSSVTAQWTSGGNPGGTTYTLEASTASDFSGTLASSATPGFSATDLSLSGNTTYFFRARATVNGADAFKTLGSTITLPGVPSAAGQAFTMVGVTSATIAWASGGNSTATLYDLTGSTAPDFSGTPASSSTFNLFATVTGLTLDSTYYFQVRARGNGFASPYLNLSSTITTPSSPGSPAAAFLALYPSSITVQWTANGNGGGVTYGVQASTASDFSGLVFSASSVNLSTTVYGLSGFTTYYFQVNASTNGYTSDFTSLGSTWTLPAPPGAVSLPFLNVYQTSVTARWSANGDGPGTRWLLQASTAANFTGTVSSSDTALLSGTALALSTNTVYFFQVRAKGGGAASEFTSLGSTTTALPPPGTAAPAFLMVGISSATAQWTAGGNAAGALYTLAASTAPGLSGLLFSSAAASLSATVINLYSNTTFYFGVKATAGGNDSVYTLLGSTLTLPPAQSQGNTFYFRQVPSNISGYDVAMATEAPVAAADSTRSANTSNAADDLVYSYVGPALGTGTLAGGNWTFNLYGDEVNSGSNANSTFKVIVYIRTGASESQYFSSVYGPQLSTAKALYTWNASAASRSVNLTDRLVVKVYATSATALTKQPFNSVDLYLDAAATQSRFAAPFDVVAPSSATDLAAATGATQGTVNLAWSAPGNDAGFKNLQVGSDFLIQYSTFVVAWSSANAQVVIATGPATAGAAQGTVVSGLTGGATYFFYLWTVDESQNASLLSNAATAMAQVPPAPGSAAPAFTAVGYSSVTAQWTANGNGAGAAYTLYASTDSLFNGTPLSSATPGLSAAVQSLSGNTTYFFRVKATVSGGDSAFLSLGSTIALPAPPGAGSPSLGFVGSSSMTVAWTNGGNSTAPVYNLQASTAANFSGTVVSALTANLTGVLSPLSPTATYYLRVSAQSRGFASPFTSLGSTITLPAAPGTAAPTYSSLGYSSVTVQWTGAGDGAGTLYTLNASTAADFSGTLASSSTYNASAVLQSLSGNATYYFQVNAQYNGNTSTYTSLGSTITLPAPPSAGSPAFTMVGVTSVTAQWGAGAAPPGTLYKLQASTAANFTGTLASSNTFNLSASVVNLSSAVLYYLQVAASGNGNTSPFTSLGSTTTLVAAPYAGTLPAVYVSSLTAQWGSGGNPAGVFFNLQASTASNFTGTLSSSQTFNLLGTIPGLTGSTTYFLRVDAVVSASSSPYTSLGSTVTLPDVPQSAVSTYTSVFASSATAQWLSGNNGPGVLYALQASTASDFSGTLASSVTANVSGQVLNLTGNATYFFQVSAQAAGMASAYAPLGSTVTRAQIPGAVSPALTAVYFSSLTAQWSNGGNSPGTLYTFNVSTASDLTGTLFSSATFNLSAQISIGIATGTIYFGQVNASGRTGSDYLSLGSTATEVLSPASAVSTFTMVGISSVTAQWLSGGNGLAAQYTLQASSAANFSGQIFSSATYGLSATLSPLLGQTTYYFRAQAADGNNASAFVSLGSTFTLFNPSVPPGAGSPPLTFVGYSSAAAQWTRLTNPVGTTLYNLQASTDSLFGGTILASATFNLQGTVPGLSGNTTYFLDVNAVVNNAPSTFTFLASTITLPAPPATAATTFTAVNASSVSVAWASGGNSTATFYAAQVSTASDFSGTIVSSVTYNLFADLTPLSPYSTYYLRVQARGTGNNSPFASLGSTITLVANPALLADSVTGLGFSSVTAQWGAGLNGAGSLYNLQASTASDFSGTIITSNTANISATLNALSTLATYYLRVDAVIGASSSAFITLGSTITLPAPPAAASPAFAMVGVTSVTAQWNASPNPAATLFNLQASTAANFTGTLSSSATYNAAATLVNLSSAVVYYLRVNAFGNGNASGYTPLGSTATLVGSPTPLATSLTSIYVSSAAAQWGSGGNPAGVFFNMQASTASDFSGTIFSSQTFNLQGTDQGLTGSTTYFLQVDAVVSGSSSAFSSLGSTVTLPDAPQSAVSTYASVFASSVAAQWLSGNNGSGAVYTLQASTAANFSGTLASSATANLSGQVSGLTGNATYFFRVNASAAGMASAYASLGSTLTQAAVPAALSPAFTAVYFSSLTAQWGGGNSPGTLYTLQVSTAIDFSGTIFSSATRNLSATIPAGNLAAATLYYADVNAGGSVNSGYLSLGSTVTQVNPPASAVSTYTMVGISSAAAQWLSGGNAAGTLYTLEANVNSNFSGTPAASSATYNSTATVASLQANTSYYFRVKATVSGQDSAYALLGSTLTKPAAPAVGNQFYLRQITDGPTGFGTLRSTETPTSGADSSFYALTTCSPTCAADDAINSGTAGQEAYISPPVATGTLAGGSWTFNFYGDAEAGSNATIKAVVLRRNTAGTETQYFASSYGPALAATKTLYTWNTAAAAQTVNPTDRLVVRVYAAQANALVKVAGKIVNFYYDSTGANSRAGAPFDITAPAAVTDLAASTSSTPTSYLLKWSAPGSDGQLGSLLAGSQFRIQYATYTANWSPAGAQLILATGPVTQGQLQSALITGLSANSTYYFALWSADNAGNVSDVSNSAQAFNNPAHSSMTIASASFPTANQGAKTALLSFLVTPSTNAANGVAWSSLRIKLMDQNGSALSSNQAGIVFSSVSLIAGALGKDTTGLYHANIDTAVVANINAPFSLTAGQQVLTVPSPAPLGASVLTGQPRYYFLVGQWAGGSAGNTVRAQVTMETDASFTDPVTGMQAVLDTAGTVASANSTAIAPAASPAGWPASLGTSSSSVEGGFLVNYDQGSSNPPLYAGTDDNYLYSINANGGAVNWKFGTSNPVRTFPSNFQDSSNIEWVYFADDGGNIYKLKDNGASACGPPAVGCGWKRSLAGVTKILSSPTFDTNVTTVYLGAPDGKVYAVNASDGTDKAGWGYNTAGALAFTGTPYLDDFTTGITSIFIGSQGGTLYRLKLADGSVASSYVGSANIYATPALDSGFVAGGTNSNVIYWGADDGVLRARTSANLAAVPASWSDFTVSPVDKIRSSPWINRCGETPKGILFGSNNGKLYKLNGTTGAKIWEYQTGGAILTNPIVLCAGDTGAAADYVYFGSDDGNVYGLKSADGTLRAGFPVNLGAPARSGPSFVIDTSTSIIVGTMDGKVSRINVGP